jgi:hypothetical protein
MRFVLIFSLFFAFKFEANDQLGLPVLATEAEIKKLQNKRSKVLSQSVARRVTKIVESLDKAGQLEEAKELLLKDKKNSEAKEKDREIARVVKDAESELKELEKRKESMKSYDRSMLFYYQAYINLSFKDNLNYNATQATAARRRLLPLDSYLYSALTNCGPDGSPPPALRSVGRLGGDRSGSCEAPLFKRTQPKLDSDLLVGEVMPLERAA